MAKAAWGAKRQCPKCSTRFYDLGNDHPIVCISCGHEFHYEPLLKSRRPRDETESAPKKVAAKPAPAKDADDDEDDVDIDVDVDDDDEDEDVLGVEDDDDDDDVSGVIVKKVEGNDD